MLAWPDQGHVDAAARRWAAREAPRHPEVLRIGYFGSYARGDWGVGSDLDLVAVVRSADVAFERRAAGWDLTGFEVPAELLVYTVGESDKMSANETRFSRVLREEVVWVFDAAMHAGDDSPGERPL